MNSRERQRGVYVTARQKKKLLEYITKHPQLITGKISQNFSHRDCQLHWQKIANECNSIPGSRKTWRQWRKTWQDLKSKTKKRHENGELPNSVTMLSVAEQEAMGIKNVSSTTNQQKTEFVTLAEHLEEDSFDNVIESGVIVNSYSDAESVTEEKVFINPPDLNKTKHNNSIIKNSEHSDSCAFNCDMLAVQEQRKIQIKEDYLSFKKDYLREKLKLLKEQTEALKSIAKGLANK